MDRAYNYVTLEPRLQIRDSKDNVVLDFLNNSDLAQKMARTMNLDHWSVAVEKESYQKLSQDLASHGPHVEGNK